MVRFSDHKIIFYYFCLQIIKLLNLYTPADEYEERVPLSFIKKIQARLQERAEAQAKQFSGEQQVCLSFDLFFSSCYSLVYYGKKNFPHVILMSLIFHISFQVTLLMDSKQSFPVRFPFYPSNIRLEDVEVPEVLNVPMLKKI